jgi:hypothetical protein
MEPYGLKKGMVFDELMVYFIVIFGSCGVGLCIA